MNNVEELEQRFAIWCDDKPETERWLERWRLCRDMLAELKATQDSNLWRQWKELKEDNRILHDCMADMETEQRKSDKENTRLRAEMKVAHTWIVRLEGMQAGWTKA